MAFTMFSGGAQSDAGATLDALSKSQAIIEFRLDGTILTANENFLAVLGYELKDIVGKHHRMFVEPAYAASPEYRTFWEQLNKGKFDTAEYKRVGKGGKEVWIRASYNPVLDRKGTPVKIVKIASDVTEEKRASADARSQLDAISRAQAVIEFNMNGEILTANANFCKAMGYQLEEIKGRHHRMFVDPEYASTSAYKEFWDKLRRGENEAAEYKRVGKGGKPVWIQASYNPIFDLNGKPYKVVKYATDATDATARKEAVAVLGAGLARLAGGDLTASIDSKFVGDMDAVRHAYNDTVSKFASIIAELRGTSGALKTATGEILSGANDLAERTTKQAAAIEETSAAMDQLAATVAENATRADKANATAGSMSRTGEETGNVMRLANEAMTRIASSSAKISGIIGMIDDIAFQTNLLALNASVEAARAGDAGKGFAVVAVEVRRLAQSAAGASSEVKALIEQSAAEVTGGSKLVTEATQKMTTMVQDIGENSSLIEAIARATQEQSSTISQVTQAVRQIDEMTQHNAALVEQTNAAIEQTEGQASELDRIVDVFTVDNAPRRQQRTQLASRAA
ncbi:MAG TPA: methyl-accepting chemotaxis protein [Arsenicitalea sp.]|nr:methyl-accepting chemotaxis protein [Arsenicitalea sp.]